MDINKFLHLSAGKWFTQRTNYLLDGGVAENNKAEITIELIPDDDSRVVQLCQKQSIDPRLSIGGAVQSWDNSVDWGKPKQQGSSLLIVIPNTDNPQQGKVIRMRGQTINTGNYLLGVDNALTLTVETAEISAEERQWFASDNLRLRTTIVKNAAGVIQTSFYSEIRKVAPKPEAN